MEDQKRGEKMKEKLSRYRILIFGIGVLLGLAFILYPFFSQLFYDQDASTEVIDFQEAVQAIDPPELKTESVKRAEAYNEALEPNLRWIDPYSEAEREEGVAIYAEMLKVKEKIGVIHIPKINVSLPLYAGTAESILQKGIGHLEGTSLPVGGINTHSVVTAHRGLPEARLFTDLDKMEVGDVFSVETMGGEIFYEVDEVVTVEPHETDYVKIIEGEDYLTLLTCTPYMINSHRLLVRGTRTDAPPEEELKEIKEVQEKDFMYYLKTYWHYFLTIILALMGVVGVLVWQDKKQEK